jgi:hypothetical protein
MPKVTVTDSKGLVQSSGTGVFFESTAIKKPTIFGLAYAAATDAAIGPAANTLTAWSFVGSAADIDLPAAVAGVRVAVQFAALLTGTGTVDVDLAGTDVFRTGSLIESRNSNKVVYDTSTAGETKLTLTPTAAHCYWDLGSVLIFTCLDTGVWDVEFITKPDPAGTGLTGTAAFAA